MKLSVVIPTYNGRTLLEACLASVMQHRPSWCEVIVVDDASTDGTTAWLREAHPDVRVVHSALPLPPCRGGLGWRAVARDCTAALTGRPPMATDPRSPAGFCRAANAGIAAARGEFVELLNNDTEVEARWAEAGIAPFADPAIGSVAPLVLMHADRNRIDSAGDHATFFGRYTKRGHRRRLAPRFLRPRAVFGASASSAFYRGDLLRRLGGFREHFGAYYEDVELAHRLRRAGYRCVFQPGSRVYHRVSATYDHGRPERHFQMARNAERIFWQYTPRWTWPCSVPAHLAWVCAQAAWRLPRGRAAAFLAGKWAAWKEGLLGRAAAEPSSRPATFESATRSAA